MADKSTKRQPIEGDAKNKVVRYVGKSNVRMITSDEWNTAIGRPHDTVTWYRDAPLNDVPLSRFDLDLHEFARCILSDAEFKLIDLVTEAAPGA